MQANILPYKQGSGSAKALAEALGIKQLKLKGSKYKGSKDKIVINWGNSMANNEVEKSTVINKPEAIQLASNKLEFFQKMRDHNDNTLDGGADYIPIPRFFTQAREAALFVGKSGPVMARTVLNGHSGAGIVYCEAVDDVFNNPAKLYTQYIPKTSEFRVHVSGGKVIDIQKKARKRDVPDDKVDWRVRNLDNGFIYARNLEDMQLTELIKMQCINAVEVCGLDFGAVDVIYHKKSKTYYILEINTAPGLAGTTVASYAKSFEQLLDRFIKNPANWRVDPWNQQ